MSDPQARGREAAVRQEAEGLLELQPYYKGNPENARRRPGSSSSRGLSNESPPRSSVSLSSQTSESVPIRPIDSTPTTSLRHEKQEFARNAVDSQQVSQTSYIQAISLADTTYASVHLLSPWFPKVDQENKEAKTFWTWKSRREVLLYNALLTVFLVFVTNLALTIVSWARLKKNPTDAYLRNLYSGDCNAVKKANIGVHLVINILSTLILSASNLCLQLIAAPTRNEIDRAHEKGIWLDIGVPSLRNLRHISRGSRVMWFLLALSSLPIHFLYNSAVISSLTQNSYAYLVITDDFLKTPFTNETITGSGPVLEGSFTHRWTYGVPEHDFSGILNSMTNDYQEDPESFTKLSTLEGLKAYQESFAWRPNIFAVVTSAGKNYSNLLPDAKNCPGSCHNVPNNHNATLLWWGVIPPWDIPGGGGLCYWTPGKWIKWDPCPDLQNWTDERALEWTMGDRFDYHIDHFLVNRHPVESEMTNSYKQCHLQCSPAILLGKFFLIAIEIEIRSVEELRILFDGYNNTDSILVIPRVSMQLYVLTPWFGDNVAM
jgi:hypothetical protein